MKNSISTFKRVEMKYIMNDAQSAAFKKAIAPYTQADEFDRYTICNIYFDTDNYEIIQRSIEKPVYKEKLRVRSYGTPGAKDEVFLELKKKYKKEVFKRRVSMPVQDLDRYIIGNEMPDVSPQIMGEIGYFMSIYHPRPMIYIAYDRVALKGRENPDLRITFDESIRFRRENLSLSEGDYGTRILDDSQRLMEIKVCGAMPLWLSQALDTQQIYPTSFSKYGYCYQTHILRDSAIAQNTSAKRYVS